MFSLRSCAILSCILVQAALIAEECDPFVFKVGGNYTYMKLSPSGLDPFHGNLGGTQASFEYKPKNAIYEGVTFLGRWGKLEAKQSLRRDIFNTDTQLRLGYTAEVADDFAMTFFTGFGWEYMSQKLSGGGSRLTLNYNEVYIPIGLLSQYEMNRFSIGLNGIWMPQVFSNVNFIPLDDARWVTKRTLANVLLELPLAYSFPSNGWKFLLELRPFFEYWQDGETLAKSETGEPLGLVKNTYYMGGCLFNLGFNF